MKRIQSLAASLLLASAPSCLYAHVRSPLDTDLAVTKLGSKVGTSSAQSVLWLIAWGDASTATAAKNGNLTTLNLMDSEQLFVFFGLYSQWTTIVYGD